MPSKKALVLSSGETPCGKCGTCIDRAAAFYLNDIEAPAL